MPLGLQARAERQGFVKPKRAVCDEVTKDRGEPGKGAIRTGRRRGGGVDDSDSVVWSEEVVCNVLDFDP